MIHNLKIALLLLIMTFVNTIMNVTYLSTTDEPAGNWGMLPLSIGFINLFAIPLSLIITSIVKLKYKINVATEVFAHNAICILLNGTSVNRESILFSVYGIIIVVISILNSIITILIYKVLQKIWSSIGASR
jgi:hypothetical protein